MTRSTAFHVFATLLAPLSAETSSAQGARFALAPATTQAVLGLAEGWDSSMVVLQRFERDREGRWQPLGAAWKGRLGADGLVWGRGLHPVPPRARVKNEGDDRAPAGVFGIGGACGYEPDIARHNSLPYFQVTPQDLWIEDPRSPDYNQHVRLNHPPRDAWEMKQQMKQNDAAHALKLFILHNAPPRAVPGGGSSIFFHIWRGGGTRATSGCTTMPEGRLRELIRWLDPRRLPVYILLPRAEYEEWRGPWRLP